jgi:molybdopterin-guanine dinucleotide biosynthesis protein A
VSAAPPFTALILAGGRSSRMGTDKALLPHPISGLPLLEHQAALLRSLPGCAELLLSAPAERPYPLADPLAGIRVIPDATPDSGPLAGLAAGLAAASHSRLLIVAVDLPALSADFLHPLLAASSFSCGIAPRHADGTFEPLCAVYPVNSSARAACTAALAAHHYSLQKLLSAACAAAWMQPHPVTADSLPYLINWNTPADLSR